MLDRVFDQGLQHHRRQWQGAQFFGYVQLQAKAIAHAQLEDFQVSARTVEFVAQGGQRVFGARQRTT
ncbi:hypothetical protein D3C71_2140700 [compost metagenome]